MLILGARQVGKTTLARQTFPNIPYCNMEEPHLRALITNDPRFQIQQRALPSLIIDEAQAEPGVYNSLRGIIDDHREKNGRFLLLGSVRPSLVRQVSESLAGRVGILELDPLTATEAAAGGEFVSNAIGRDRIAGRTIVCRTPHSYLSARPFAHFLMPI